MKNILYISFAIIIVLSSCKSNSFTTQRYTKFGHAKHKTVSNERITKTNVPVKENKVQEEEVRFAPEILVANSSKEMVINAAQHLPTIHDKVIPEQTSTISSEKIKTANDNLPVVKKKADNQKSSEAKRIIGTLLKIVLWVIILAVVLGVIIIIGALA